MVRTFASEEAYQNALNERATEERLAPGVVVQFDDSIASVRVAFESLILFRASEIRNSNNFPSDIPFHIRRPRSVHFAVLEVLQDYRARRKAEDSVHLRPRGMYSSYGKKFSSLLSGISMTMEDATKLEIEKFLEEDWKGSQELPEVIDREKNLRSKTPPRQEENQEIVLLRKKKLGFPWWLEVGEEFEEDGMNRSRSTCHVLRPLSGFIEEQEKREKQNLFDEEEFTGDWFDDYDEVEDDEAERIREQQSRMRIE